MVAPLLQMLLCRFVECRHVVFAGNIASTVAAAALQDFEPEAAALVNFQQIDRNVLRLQIRELIQRLPPTGGSLMREAGDEVKADVADSCGAQDRDGSVDVRAAVHAAGGNQFFVDE